MILPFQVFRSVNSRYTVDSAITYCKYNSEYLRKRLKKKLLHKKPFFTMILPILCLSPQKKTSVITFDKKSLEIRLIL